MTTRLLLALIPLLACGDAGGGTSSGAGSTSDATTGAAASTGDPEAPTTAGEASTTDASTGAPTTGGPGGTTGATTGELEDLDMTPEDFGCILEWDKVRKYRITNLLGHTDEALAVADDPAGGVFPVGTVIQLIPNEAMVKRHVGWSPENSDWEFFFLDVTADGTSIAARGTTDVVNGFGGNCFDCHAKAAPQWDRICEEGHGCDPLPFTPEQIEMVQMGDPRCM